MKSAAPEINEFSGLSLTGCCTACGPTHCVISAAPVCAHPNKAGLQASMQREPAVLERYARAKAVIETQRLAAKLARDAGGSLLWNA